MATKIDDSTVQRPSDEVACPYLGLDDDPGTRFTFASTAHRCHVGRRQPPVDLSHQAAFCLTAMYSACPRYRPEVALGPVPATRPAVSTPVVLRPVDRASSPGNKPRRRRVVVAVASLIMLVSLVVVAGMATGPAFRGVLGFGAPTLSQGTSPASSTALPPTPSPTPASTPSATPSPSPTPSATSSPAPSASPRPSPTPLIHVVAAGETLTGIAARYDVTIKAIQKANGITDPSLILVGQRLVIPTRP